MSLCFVGRDRPCFKLYFNFPSSLLFDFLILYHRQYQHLAQYPLNVCLVRHILLLVSFCGIQMPYFQEGLPVSSSFSLDLLLHKIYKAIHQVLL